MFTQEFLTDTTERAVATFAQTFIAIVGVMAPLTNTDLLSVNYAPIMLVSLVAAGLAVLKALALARK